MFILAFFLKSGMILEIHVRWITLLTAFSHYLESTLSQTFIMHRLVFYSFLALWNFNANSLYIVSVLQIRINNSFVSSFREAIYKLKCRSEVCMYFVGIINGCLTYLFKKELYMSSFMLCFNLMIGGTQVVCLKFSPCTTY